MTVRGRSFDERTEKKERTIAKERETKDENLLRLSINETGG